MFGRLGLRRALGVDELHELLLARVPPLVRLDGIEIGHTWAANRRCVSTRRNRRPEQMCDVDMRRGVHTDIRTCMFVGACTGAAVSRSGIA